MRKPWFVVIALLVACGNKTESPPTEADDPALKFVADGTREAVAKIKEAIAANKPDDAYLKCAHMANVQDLEASKPHQALAAELKLLCEKELPLAVISKHVGDAEAARKAKPDEKVLSECFDATLNTAYEALVPKDAAKELMARYVAACPDAKI